jgi:hypothetical protein
LPSGSGSSIFVANVQERRLEFSKDETILIVPTDMAYQGIVHTVRFHQFLPTGDIEVMDPNLNRTTDKFEFVAWPRGRLKEWKRNIFKLKMSAVVKP